MQRCNRRTQSRAIRFAIRGHCACGRARADVAMPAVANTRDRQDRAGSVWPLLCDGYESEASAFGWVQFGDGWCVVFCALFEELCASPYAASKKPAVFRGAATTGRCDSRGLLNGSDCQPPTEFAHAGRRALVHPGGRSPRLRHPENEFRHRATAINSESESTLPR